MNKKLLYILFLFFLNLVSAQQNDEFKKVKNYYDYQKVMLNTSFKKKFEEENDTLSKMMVKNDFEEFIKKMDSIQNVAFIGALVKVKNREDLEVLNIYAKTSTQKKGSSSFQNNSKKPAPEENISKPEYPGGINELRSQISQIFYYDAVNTDQKTVKTSIEFVVERDGSITFVHANGENFVMNRQAEIAIYLLPEKFSPAKLKGENVRYRFRLPITMNFE